MTDLENNKSATVPKKVDEVVEKVVDKENEDDDVDLFGSDSEASGKLEM